MLRLDNSSQQNPSLWESVLPRELSQMNEELTKVDKLLDDERFFAPFRARFGGAHEPADKRGSLAMITTLFQGELFRKL